MTRGSFELGLEGKTCGARVTDEITVVTCVTRHSQITRVKVRGIDKVAVFKT